MNRILEPLHSVNPDLQAKIAKVIDTDLNNFLTTGERDFTATGDVLSEVKDLNFRLFHNTLMSELAVADRIALDFSEWDHSFVGFLT